VRRTEELAFFRCYAATPVPADPAGRHRRRRWTLLSVLAHAPLAFNAAHEHAAAPSPAALIPLTRNEIKRLLTRLVLAPPPTRRSRGLAVLAATTPIPRPRQPLPPPNGKPLMIKKIYGGLLGVGDRATQRCKTPRS
jgi:hypothetical protein